MSNLTEKLAKKVAKKVTKSRQKNSAALWNIEPGNRGHDSRGKEVKKNLPNLAKFAKLDNIGIWA